MAVARRPRRSPRALPRPTATPDPVPSAPAGPAPEPAVALEPPPAAGSAAPSEPAAAPEPDASPGPAPGSPPEERRRRLGVLAALVAVTAYVGLVDPSGSGLYPPCPSRLVLGLDCPGCGGLRGTHDLLHGDVAAALDHNALLPLFLAGIAVALVAWLAPLAGRPVRTPHPPPWAWVTAGVVVVAFTVARNLPIPALAGLGSG